MLARDMHWGDRLLEGDGFWGIGWGRGEMHWSGDGLGMEKGLGRNKGWCGRSVWGMEMGWRRGMSLGRDMYLGRMLDSGHGMGWDRGMGLGMEMGWQGRRVSQRDGLGWQMSWTREKLKLLPPDVTL